MIYMLIGNKKPYTYTLLKPNWKENHTTTTHTHTRRTLKLVTIVKKPCSCILSDRYFFRVKVFFSIPIGTCGLIMASTTSYESCCVAGTNKNMHIAWVWWWWRMFSMGENGCVSKSCQNQIISNCGSCLLVIVNFCHTMVWKLVGRICFPKHPLRSCLSHDPIKII